MTENWHQNFKSKNREALIAAAKVLFMKQSFLNVNIKDVCSEAGISRVTFYKHFQSMNELILEVQVEILKNMTGYVKNAAAADMSGKEMLASMLEAWVRYASLHLGYIKFVLLFDLHYEAYDSSKELKEQYDLFINREKEQHFLLDALQIGYMDGTLKPDPDPLNTAHFIFVSMMSLLQKMSLVSEADQETAQSDLRFAKRFVEMLVHHLST
ncbi:TetR/AcrR family transcriptional regulator [Paenibacillus xylanilyticus]|uniref:TetR/AcrR family transcriptional regulator n=1 Tax=Paenibacillus xylanilyticus TaxID=248903 RepID=A0A7Y6EUA1_9BACL|nr:TetR/AcrR family transcriptional regulator [Paenibacillus xylanilyticus]NUU76882.1 TetR/AcrR family transcriptional regulator [Paenibacillus xylanilyticus]